LRIHVEGHPAGENPGRGQVERAVEVTADAAVPTQEMAIYTSHVWQRMKKAEKMMKPTGCRD